jgi:hypothetical protein
MPLIQIKVLEGTLTTEQKNEMIAKVSNIVAEIEAGPILRPRKSCCRIPGA